jgi:hypothetical protein
MCGSGSCCCVTSLDISAGFTFASAIIANQCDESSVSARSYSSTLSPAHLPRAYGVCCGHLDFIATDVPPMRFECKAHRFGFGALSSLLIIYRSSERMYEYERGLPVCGSRNRGVDRYLCFGTGSPWLYTYHSSRHGFMSAVLLHGKWMDGRAFAVFIRAVAVYLLLYDAHYAVGWWVLSRRPAGGTGRCAASCRCLLK